MAVIFHIVADSMLVAADGVPGFFPGVAFENLLDCQATLVQPAVVCRSHRFFQFTDLAFCFHVPHSSSVFFSIRLQEEKRMQFNSIYIVSFCCSLHSPVDYNVAKRYSMNLKYT